MNSKRFSSDKRRLSRPSLSRNVNMFPFKEVYGMVAPFLVIPGIDAMSLSYNSFGSVIASGLYKLYDLYNVNIKKRTHKIHYGSVRSFRNMMPIASDGIV